jgi:Family of unknown function (DUF6348)
MTDPHDVLAKLMRAHGAPVITDGAWLVSPDHPARIGAWIVQEREHGDVVIVQLDVHVATADGRTIVESFAGLGADTDAAVGNAMDNFARNTFHVLLAAFWDITDTQQVEFEQWAIAGETWRVMLGPCSIRRQEPDQPALPANVIALFQGAIEQAALADGLNWFRWFYCDNKVGEPIIEALMNNEPWPEGVAALEEADWPQVENFWSARLFMILDRPEAM